MTISSAFSEMYSLIINDQREVLFGHGEYLYKIGEIPEIVSENLTAMSKYISLLHFLRCKNLLREEFRFNSTLEDPVIDRNFRIKCVPGARSHLEYPPNYESNYDINLISTRKFVQLQVSERNPNKVTEGTYEMRLTLDGVIISKDERIFFTLPLDRVEWDKLYSLVTKDGRLGVYSLLSLLIYSIEKWTGSVVKPEFYSVFDDYLDRILSL